MSGTNRQRRRILIVNRAVQKRIIKSVILVPTIGLATSAMVVAIFSRRLLNEATVADADLPSLVPLFFTVLFFCLASTVVIAIQGLRFSHHIAGPAYRICQDLKRAREDGDGSVRVTLREGDYLEEVAEEVNAFLEWVEPQLVEKSAAEDGEQVAAAPQTSVQEV